MTEEILLMQLAMYSDMVLAQTGSKPRRVGVNPEAWRTMGCPDLAAGVRVYPRRGQTFSGLAPASERYA